MKDKRLTAREILDRLHADPAWVAAQAEREADRFKLKQVLQKAQEPVIEDLAKVGFLVNSVWELVNRPNDYSNAIPILIDHLKVKYPVQIKEGIARALAVPDARPYWDILVAAFKS